jgi:hypothetical protein
VTVEEAALAVGATVLGDPPHYLLDAEQIAQLIALLRDEVLPPPPY